MVATALNKEINNALSRIDHSFTNIPRTRYWISINHYHPDNGYSLFFNIQPPRTFSKSLPLLRLQDCSFDDLLVVLKAIRQSYQFTFEYLNFTRQKRRILYKEVK